MNQSPSLTSPTGSVGPTPPVRPPAVLVMALRAAEQHVLVVVGEADMHTAGHLRTQLLDLLRSKPPSVLIELGGLEFCDLAGLDALHDAVRTAHDGGVALTFRGMSTQLAWLHRTFPPHDRVPPPSPSGVAERPPGAPAAISCGTSALVEYLVGRDHSRRGAVGATLHAVPTSDTTRSAVCGARILPATTSWTGVAHGSCPDCVAAVAASGVVDTPGGLSEPEWPSPA